MRTSLLMALFLVVVNSPNAVLAQYAPRVGKPHPDFVLPNIENGKPIRLSQYRGKKVLLVHFASW